MKMFARFDEIPAMTSRYEGNKTLRTEARTDGHTDGQCENSIPSTKKFAGGKNNTHCE